MLVMVSVCGSGGQLGLAMSRGYGSGSQLGGELWGGFVDCLVLVSMGLGVLDLRCFGVLVFPGFCSQWVLAFGC